MEENKLYDKAQELKHDFNEKKEQVVNKANDLKQHFNEKKEQVIDKAGEWKKEIKEKKDELVDKMKHTTGSNTCGDTKKCCNGSKSPKQESSYPQQHDKTSR